MEHARLAARDMMIKPIDATKTLFDITHGGNVTSPVPLPGTPQRIDGLSIGWVQMDRPPPHAGEVHYDGDEILIIVSGRVRVIGDSPPAPVELGAGEAPVWCREGNGIDSKSSSQRSLYTSRPARRATIARSESHAEHTGS